MRRFLKLPLALAIFFFNISVFGSNVEETTKSANAGTEKSKVTVASGPSDDELRKAC